MSLNVVAHVAATSAGGGHDREALAADLAYWRTQLRDLPAPSVPTDYRRPAVPSDGCGRVPVAGSPALADAVRRFSDRHQVTVFMTLLAAWQALLARYTGQHDVVVGIAPANTPAENRSAPPLAHTLVIRTDLSGNPTARELLERVRAVVLAAYAHQGLPFGELIAETAAGSDLMPTPPVQAFIALEAALDARGEPHAPSGEAAARGGTVLFDLELRLKDGGAALTGDLAYRTDLFDAGTIAGMAARYLRLLTGLVTAPEERVLTLPLLSPSERAEVVETWNMTACSYDARTVHEQVAAQAARRPATVSVRAPEGERTYASLLAEARRMARVLRAAGVGPEVPTAVCLERSPALVASALAVWEAGGVYVPIDPASPRERLAFMIRDSRAAVLVTTTALRAKAEATAARVVALDVEAPRIAGEAAAALPQMVGADHLACILYTSGTTTRPTGVAVTHRNLAQYLAWCRVAYRMELQVDALWHSPIAGDATLTAMLTPLVTGGTVVIVPDAPGGGALHRALHETPRRVLVKATPHELRALAAALTPGDAARVAVLIVSGEAPRPETVAWWRTQAPDTLVIHEYGQPETTVGCCTYNTERVRAEWPTVPIGRPILNAQVYVVDESGGPTPPGMPGELLVGGPGVSRGYQGQPALTAERFVPDAFSGRAGGRLFASGDRVRASAEGALELLGRSPRRATGAAQYTGRATSSAGANP